LAKGSRKCVKKACKSNKGDLKRKEKKRKKKKLEFGVGGGKRTPTGRYSLLQKGQRIGRVRRKRGGSGRKKGKLPGQKKWGV